MEGTLVGYLFGVFARARVSLGICYFSLKQAVAAAVAPNCKRQEQVFE